MTSKISKNDPRLTAYALGEMDAEETKAFEAVLERDLEAQAEVQAIRGFAENLREELQAEGNNATEGVVATNAEEGVFATKQHETTRKGQGGAGAEVIEFGARERRRTSRIYFWGGILSAAAVVALVVNVSLEQKLRDGADGIEYQKQSQERKRAYERAKIASEPRRKERSDPGTHLDFMLPEPATVGMTMPQVTEEFSDGLQRSSVIPARVARKFKAADDVSQERYERLKETGFSEVGANPLSTFSIDVDTAGYSNVRRYLESGRLPPREAVRVEEMVNYFSYSYASPKASDETPVAATLEVASCPWAPEHRLARIGLKAREMAAESRPPANLVLLLDTSGSMESPNKLPLVKQAVKLLIDQLRPQDHLAIVTYAGSSGLALPSTEGTHKQKMREAIEELTPGGSTYGSRGIELAYDIAKANLVAGGVNRVILCTDGDFNVGTTSETELQALIQAKAKSGVFLTVLGFGMGNLKDSTLEMLADKGNGNYGYVDSLQEARKLFVEQAGGTLVTVAKDVKVQVEFNPARVAMYRLVGYENRRLAAEDFNNDQIDAGEMGAGHTVTALYEIIPAGAAPATVDALKYQVATGTEATKVGELLTVKVRYKPVDKDQSLKLEFPLRDAGARFETASGDFQFAASVAAFGQLLSGSAHAGEATLPKIRTWVKESGQANQDGYRREFLDLVARAQQIQVQDKE